MSIARTPLPSWWRRLFWGEGRDQREIKAKHVEWKKESGKLERSYPPRHGGQVPIGFLEAMRRWGGIR